MSTLTELLEQETELKQKIKEERRKEKERMRKEREALQYKIGATILADFSKDISAFDTDVFEKFWNSRKPEFLEMFKK